MKERKELRRAAKFLHETVAQLVREYKPKKIIDLGSGHGGLPVILHKEGFDITGTEMNPSMNMTDLPYIQIDLNKSIKTKEKFDMVLCTEVIEHLYNTKKLFRDAYFLLEDGGHFIFTTPNNQNWFSRVFFFFTGKFPSFQGVPHGPDRAWFEPHITPIFTWQVNLLVRDLFTVEKITFNRSIVPFFRFNLPWKTLFFGQNLIMVLRKKD